jgi:hypothetical protein
MNKANKSRKQPVARNGDLACAAKTPSNSPNPSVLRTSPQPLRFARPQHPSACGISPKGRIEELRGDI